MKGKFRKFIRNDRGAIFLETGLVMPVFLVLLCLCIDLPRIIVIRQRLYSAQKLVSEIRARNKGNLSIGTSELKRYCFDDKICDGLSLQIHTVPDRSSLFSGFIQSIQAWMTQYLGGFFTGVVKFLANIVTGGTLEPYFIKVFNADVFYSGSVGAHAPTLLPEEAYSAFANAHSPTSNITLASPSYSAGCDSCKYTGTSFISAIVDWLEKEFGI